MSEDLKAIIERSVEAWNTGDLTIVDEIYAKDFVNHNPLDPNQTDLDSLKNYISEARKGMPDIQVEIKDMIAEGDKAVCRWVCSATVAGLAFGPAATGKKATWTGMTINRYEGGKIVETWWNEDIYGMLQQLGVIPSE
ncbi:MAG: ester cyclase [Desulfobacterales bacterium]|nr:ester cyclase [Desulfobacterales bacterium]